MNFTDERRKRLEALYRQFEQMNEAEESRRDVHPSLRRTLAGTITGVVTQVLDGDTVVITRDNGERIHVRLAEIDAPEIAHVGMGGQSYGPEASSYLASLVQNKRVQFTVSGESYGRATGTLVQGGRNMSLEMVRKGYAIPYYRYLSGSQLNEFTRAADKAQTERAGLWGGTFQSAELYRHSYGLLGGKDSFTAQLRLPTTAQFGPRDFPQTFSANVPVQKRGNAATSYQLSSSYVPPPPRGYQGQMPSASITNLHKGDRLNVLERIGEGLLFTSMGGAASAMYDAYAGGKGLGGILAAGGQTYARDAYYGALSALTGRQQRTGQRGEFSYVFEKAFGMRQRAGKIDAADLLGFAADTLINPARLVNLPGAALSLGASQLRMARLAQPWMKPVKDFLGRKFNLFYDLDQLSPQLSNVVQQALHMKDERMLKYLSRLDATGTVADVVARGRFQENLRPGITGTILNAYDQSMNMYKKFVTGYWPMFHARNVMGNVMQGTGEAGWSYWRGMYEMLRDPNRAYLMRYASSPGQLGSVGGLPGYIANAVERWTRTPYLYAQQRKGYSIPEAMQNMQHVFYNYNPRFMTPFEKTVMSRLDMWYAFHKGGAQYWPQAIGRNATRYEMLYRAQEQSQQPGAKLPWYRDTFSFGSWKVGGSMLEDYSRMVSGDARFISGSAHPIMAMLAEIATNWTPFKQRSITQDTSPGRWRDLFDALPAGLGNMLGYNGQTMDYRTKYLMERLGARLPSTGLPLMDSRTSLWEKILGFTSPIQRNNYSMTERARIDLMHRRTQAMPPDSSAFSRFMDFLSQFSQPTGTAGAVQPGTGSSNNAIVKSVATGVAQGLAQAQARGGSQSTAFNNLAAAVNGLAVKIINTMAITGPYTPPMNRATSGIDLNDPRTMQIFKSLPPDAQADLLREARMSPAQVKASWATAPDVFLAASPAANKQWQREMANLGVPNTPYGGAVPPTGTMGEAGRTHNNLARLYGGRLGKLFVESKPIGEQSAWRAYAEKYANYEDWKAGNLSPQQLEAANKLVDEREKRWQAGKGSYFSLAELQGPFPMGQNWMEMGLIKAQERFQDFERSFTNIRRDAFPDDTISGVWKRGFLQRDQIIRDAKRQGLPYEAYKDIIEPGGALYQGIDLKTEEIARKIAGVNATVLAKQATAMPEGAGKFAKETEAELAKWNASEERQKYVRNAIITAKPGTPMYEAEIANMESLNRKDTEMRIAIEEEGRKKFLAWLAKQSEREASELAELHKKQFAYIKSDIETKILGGEITSKQGYVRQREELLRQGKEQFGVEAGGIVETFHATSKLVQTSIGAFTQAVAPDSKVLSAIGESQTIEGMIEATKKAIEYIDTMPKQGDSSLFREARTKLVTRLEALLTVYQELQTGEVKDTRRLGMAQTQLARDVAGIGAKLVAEGGMMVLPSYTRADGTPVGPLTPSRAELPWYKRIGRTDPELLAFQQMQWSDAAKMEVLTSAKSVAGAEGSDKSPLLTLLNTKGAGMSWEEMVAHANAQPTTGASELDLKLKEEIAGKVMEIDQNITKSHQHSLQEQVQATAAAFGQMEQTFQGLYEATGQQAEAFWYLSKAMSMATAIVVGTEAVLKAYAAGSSLGPVVAATYAGIAAAFVGAQVGIIAAQTFQGPQKKAAGGRISGPAGTDVVPVLASDGEWVIQQRAVEKYGEGFVSSLNKGKVSIADAISDVTPRRSRDRMHDYVATTQKSDDTTIIIENKSGVPMTMKQGQKRMDNGRMLKTMIMELQTSDPQFRKSTQHGRG